MSNEAKFTGWRALALPNSPDYMNYGVQFGVDGGVLFADMPNNAARANLIAAAPDLYAALMDCLWFLENDAGHLPSKPEIMKARLALSKARGEA